jgi:hypothetical protein
MKTKTKLPPEVDPISLIDLINDRRVRIHTHPLSFDSSIAIERLDVEQFHKPESRQHDYGTAVLFI